jgi:hypothetical protein
MILALFVLSGAVVLLLGWGYNDARLIRQLFQRIERMEAIVADARPDLLAAVPKPQAALPAASRFCGIPHCIGAASPICPALSCAKCCRKYCPVHDK